MGPLLKYEKLQVDAMLAVSAVVHSFRRARPKADSEPAILEIVYHLEQVARAECERKSDDEQFDSDKVSFLIDLYWSGCSNFGFRLWLL